MAPSKWRDVKSGQVLQPPTRQIAREIEQHASQCGFNIVPLNEIASQQEMTVERLELGIKRGDHHCPGDGGKHHFEPKSCFRKGHSGICPICFGIFKKQRNGGCRDHFKK
ncbi:hypothetical protein LTR70_004010 [Exophiala xenobiotica]|nr:hypothetical protein LTR70_004010 [Exophiala xenobiotica]